MKSLPSKPALDSKEPIVDKVAMNILIAANQKQAIVTQDLRRREEALNSIANSIAKELESIGQPDLAKKLRSLGKLTKKPTKMIQEAAAKAAKESQ